MAEDEFIDDRDELKFHLIRAEYHLRKALVVLARMNPKRSVFYAALLQRAHEIALALYRQEAPQPRSKREPPPSVSQ